MSRFNKVEKQNKNKSWGMCSKYPMSSAESWPQAPMAQAQGHSSLDLENQDTAATELIETTSSIGDGKPR